MNIKSYLVIMFMFMNFYCVSAQDQTLVRKANSGDANAMFELAMYYRRKAGDQEMAVKWLMKASVKGHFHSDYYLAHYYMDGDGGLRKDSFLAYNLFEIAAKQGHLDSMYELGMTFFETTVIENAAKKSTDWLEKYVKSCKDDVSVLCSCAELELYFRYQGGLGIAKNIPLSMKYLWASVNHGKNTAVTAYNVLGECYLNGNGVEKNKEEAIKYFVLSSDNGCALADGNLGVIYYNDKKYDIAMKYLKKACEDEYQAWPSPTAMRYMSYCYQYGLGGVSKDNSKASYWMTKAKECKYQTTIDIIRH